MEQFPPLRFNESGPVLVNEAQKAELEVRKAP